MQSRVIECRLETSWIQTLLAFHKVTAGILGTNVIGTPKADLTFLSTFSLAVAKPACTLISATWDRVTLHVFEVVFYFNTKPLSWPEFL